MLPGWIAGHYELDELTIDLVPLARAAGARFVAAQIRKLDLANRIAFTERDEPLGFDVLSIATGAVIDVDAVAARVIMRCRCVRSTASSPVGNTSCSALKQRAKRFV